MSSPSAAAIGAKKVLVVDPDRKVKRVPDRLADEEGWIIQCSPDNQAAPFGFQASQLELVITGPKTSRASIQALGWKHDSSRVSQSLIYVRMERAWGSDRQADY
jgi:hypothetical protein